MCGIVAWISKDPGQPVSSPLLANAINLLRHRGPDQQQLFLENANRRLISSSETAIKYTAEAFDVGLAHSRLSIIDLTDKANQPMVSPDGRFVLTFNGEIYNYVEIADELRRGGVSLQTSSDTEVLLQALITWGEDAIPKLNGMWAFAFLDRDEKRILISRDRFGKKPLFYFHDKKQFVLASEFKAIFAIIGEQRREFSTDYLNDFLDFGWPTYENQATAYKHIKHVAPGSAMRLDTNSLNLESRSVASVDSVLSKLEGTPLDIADTVESAVRLRLRADVPTAVLLSGGVDSSIVAGFAKIAETTDSKIYWYTGDTKQGKDLPHAIDVAKKLGVSVKTINCGDATCAIELLREMNAQYELPIQPNGNSVAMYQMYAAMASDGIRVVLDGTGGDEIFGGYFNFYAKNVVADHTRHLRLLSAYKFAQECDEFEHYERGALKAHFWKSLGNSIGLKKNERLRIPRPKTGSAC